jgi:probable rRNA maturation factor
MAVEVLFEDVNSFEFDRDALVHGLGVVVSDFQRVLGDITVVFCSDDFILNANKEFLNHDYFTDIITFDYCEENVVSGDLLVSVDTVRSNSVLYDVVFSDELFRVVVHGVLHLCGLGDKTDDEIFAMRSAEERYLSLLVNPF